MEFQPLVCVRVLSKGNDMQSTMGAPALLCTSLAAFLYLSSISGEEVS